MERQEASAASIDDEVDATLGDFWYIVAQQEQATLKTMSFNVASVLRLPSSYDQADLEPSASELHSIEHYYAEK